ncbi:P-loop containing nucleoside triphosphate hydrolase protein [Violaceomyces palustris]|uniref:P-loop containing nucleoside triphosphate hydrolase protein n=1 Tax=Violaceomyces palustris TaxID=1673888 RepID=A0ACD0NTX9_9BASI|nr:P-loop containing nucleoside triphosphate hydrolase protein [Violaceomyces palustris]
MQASQVTEAASNQVEHHVLGQPDHHTVKQTRDHHQTLPQPPASLERHASSSVDHTRHDSPPQTFQHMLVLCGVVGSGKSTLARSLHENFDSWVRCNQDELGSRDAVFSRARRSLLDGKNVIIDRTNIDPPQRRTWLDLADWVSNKAVIRENAARSHQLQPSGSNQASSSTSSVTTDQGASNSATSTSEPPPSSASVRKRVKVLVTALVFDTPYQECQRRLRARTDHETIHSPEKALEILSIFSKDYVKPDPSEGFHHIVRIIPQAHHAGASGSAQQAPVQSDSPNALISDAQTDPIFQLPLIPTSSDLESLLRVIDSAPLHPGILPPAPRGTAARGGGRGRGGANGNVYGNERGRGRGPSSYISRNPGSGPDQNGWRGPNAPREQVSLGGSGRIFQPMPTAVSQSHSSYSGILSRPRPPHDEGAWGPSAVTGVRGPGENEQATSSKP